MSNGLAKVFRNKRAGGVMRTALAMLCFGGVSFLVYVLVSLLKEANVRPSTAVIHFARYVPPRTQAEIMEMNLEVQKRNIPARNGQRIAL